MTDLFKFIKHVEEEISSVNEATQRQVLKTFSGKIIGYIDMKSNGDQELKNYTGIILGRYLKDKDVTQNYSGKILTQGNTLTMLLK